MAIRLSKDELLTSLREKHGHDFVAMIDLEAPSSEFMMKYFATVVAALGVDIKGMTNHALLQSLPHADTYKDTLPYAQVFFAVKKVYPIPKYLENFSLLSLMEPKPEDVYCVAVMDNFYDYYYQRTADLLDPRLQELSAMREQLHQLEQQKAALQHQLNDQAAARSKRVMEQAKAEEEIQVLDREVQEDMKKELQLEAELVEQEKALRVLRLEVEGNRQKLEQLQEQQEMQAELKELVHELEQLRKRKAEQIAELTEKRSTLQEKAARTRFLEETIALETQATHEVAQLVALAAKTEKHKKSVQENEAKKEQMVKAAEVETKKLHILEAKLAAVKDDLAAEDKDTADLKKKNEDMERKCQIAKCTVAKKTQERITLQENVNSAKLKIVEMKEMLSILDQNFQKEHDKLYEKAESIDAQMIDWINKRLDE